MFGDSYVLNVESCKGRGIESWETMIRLQAAGVKKEYFDVYPRELGGPCMGIEILGKSEWLSFSPGCVRAMVILEYGM